MKEPRLVLASGSPRRRQLLADLGLDCEVKTADVDETPYKDELPASLAGRLACSKAQAIADSIVHSDAATLVIAADTVVGMGDAIFGKPQDGADAARMLSSLRGRQHQVHSAICVIDVKSRTCRTRINTTQVEMRAYDNEEIDLYVASGDPLDKAGAYAIQNPVFAPVRALDGCISSVMGLPLGDLCELLAEFDVIAQCGVVEVCERQANFACCQRDRRRKHS